MTRGSPAVELIDRAVHLLRGQRASTWAVFLAGAAPMMLSALLLLFDMRSSQATDDRCASEAFLCAACFLWFNICRSRFAQLLISKLADQEPGSWKLAAAPSNLALQTSKLFLMPLACLALLPLPGAVAFFRTATALSGENRMKRAMRVATMGQRQNSAALLLLSVFSAVVFLNILIFLAALPELFRMFTGTENEFTRLGFGINTVLPLGAAAIGITWLIVDPLFQAVYTVRWFTAESRESGADLLVAIRRLGAIVALVLLFGHTIRAEAPARVTRDKLDSSIDRVLNEPEYRWHVESSESATTKNNGMIERAVKWMGGAIRRLRDTIAEYLRWLFRNRNSTSGNEKLPAAGPLVWTPMLLLVALAAIIAIVVLRSSRARKKSLPGPTANPPRVIRLDDEQLTASDLPEERWLALANECLSAGDYRLAVRALYLANLSYLGRKQLLSIAPFKSNRDYAREIVRHARNEALGAAFSANLRLFEQGWYGMYPINAAHVAEFEVNLTSMRTYAER